METLILVIHIVTIVFLIILVLLQQGKGSAAGAAFGSGASNTMFGSQGSFSFLMKLTYGLAFTFFMTSLMLTYFSYQKGNKSLLAPKSNQAIPVQEKTIEQPVAPLQIPVQKPIEKVPESPQKTSSQKRSVKN